MFKKKKFDKNLNIFFAKNAEFYSAHVVLFASFRSLMPRSIVSEKEDFKIIKLFHEKNIYNK